MQISSQSFPPAGQPGRPAGKVPTAPWLLARAAFGWSRRDAAEVTARGHQGWVDWQLQHDLIPDPEVDQELARYPWLLTSPHDSLSDPTIQPSAIADDYKAIRLARAVLTRRQLFERTVEFWADHFNVFMGRFMRIYDDETVWRTHAFGTFRELLHAVTRSASMLAYLDGDENRVGAPNENLAREIFELHTLGVDGGYTETDVREFARCLTGWTFCSDAADPNFGDFLFVPQDHDPGTKRVLGITFIGDGGTSEVTRILDLVADHPATIDFVTAKMARWFLGDEPPMFELQEARTAWQQTGGSIREIVRALVSERAILAVQQRGQESFRRPFDWLAAALRASEVDLPLETDAVELMRALGQAPFEWPAPDGYPVARARWVQLVQPRWAAAASFARPAGTFWRHAYTDLAHLIQSPSGTVTPRSRWARRLSQTLTGGRLSAVDIIEIQGHLDALPPQTPVATALGEAIELCLSCPSYQVI